MKRIIFKLAGWAVGIFIIYYLLQRFGVWVYIRSLWHSACEAGIFSKIIGYIKEAYQNL